MHDEVLCISLQRGWWFESLAVEDNKSFVETLVRSGFIPTAPLHPNSAIAIETLEFFAALSCRCPSLSIQAFVKSICDIHIVST